MEQVSFEGNNNLYILINFSAVLKVPKYLSILQSFGVFLDNNKDDYTLITSKFGVINTFYLLLLYAFNFNANS